MESRVVEVYNNLNGINSGWVGIQSIVKVKRTVNYMGGKNKNKVFKETAYFISSLPSNTKAKIFNQGIRSHWSIENSLHYIKDETFKEDSSRIRTKNAPANLSLIRNIAINIFRENNYENIAQAIRLISNDIARMFEMITG
jgi:predicted transposase YbfD/YdcC